EAAAAQCGVCPAGGAFCAGGRGGVEYAAADPFEIAPKARLGPSTDESGADETLASATRRFARKPVPDTFPAVGGLVRRAVSDVHVGPAASLPTLLPGGRQ